MAKLGTVLLQKKGTKMSDSAANYVSGQTDLYAALRLVAAQGAQLPDLLAALDQGDAKAQDTAQRLRSVDQGLLQAVMRRGRGESATKAETKVRAYLAECTPKLLFTPDPAQAKTTALLTAGQRPDMPAFSDRAFDAWFQAQNVDYGLGAYGEKRSVYQTAQFADAASPERRTVHTGIDIFAPAMTPVFAPLAGVVKYLTYNADPLDYGHTLILEHDAGGVAFYSLYGHLAQSLPHLLAVGDQVQPGQHIADLGDWHENGGWAAHIHFQIMTDMLDQTGGNFYGVGHESLWDVWSGICIDPNLVLRIPPERFALSPS
jgi:murein DD-endopeptidase MepM/ murein hydrolase activator NlpD